MPEGTEKKPTSTFFINIEPRSNNKAVKHIKHIYQQVKIEILENPRLSCCVRDARNMLNVQKAVKQPIA